MDAALDAMQASATAAFPADDADGLSKRLDEVVGLLAKAPSSRLRELVAKHKPAALSAVAASGTSLDALVQAALEALWAATGEWVAMNSLLHAELDAVVAEASQWMRLSVSAASELPEARIKELIKTRGGGRAVMPKARGKRGAGSGGAEEDAPKKGSLLTKNDCEYSLPAR
jgi:hypothetical protein